MPSRSRPTRRDILKAAPALAASALAACRNRPYRRGDFVVAPRSTVGLYAAASYGADFAGIIGRGLQDFALDVRGKAVLLKPNVVEYTPGTPINTDPAVVAGAAEAFLRAGAREVTVAEGPGHRRDIEYLLGATGLGDRLADLRLRFTDLNHDDVRLVPLRSRFTGLDALALPAEVLRADVIVSMPKLKTHHWTGMTCSMKNLFGVVPGAVYGWPKNLLHARGIENSILDLCATVRPAFTIVDAVVGMEGDGPIMGTAKPLGFVAMGSDQVAVDSTCARLIGFEPQRIGYLAQAADFLGHLDAARIDVRGESLARFQTRVRVNPAFAPLQAPVAAGAQ